MGKDIKEMAGGIGEAINMRLLRCPSTEGLPRNGKEVGGYMGGE